MEVEAGAGQLTHGHVAVVRVGQARELGRKRVEPSPRRHRYEAKRLILRVAGDAPECRMPQGREQLLLFAH